MEDASTGSGSGVVVVAQMLTDVAMPVVLSLTLTLTSTSAKSGWRQAADLVIARSGCAQDWADWYAVCCLMMCDV
jgi:hypothetical protein